MPLDTTQVRLNPFCRLTVDETVSCELLLEESSVELPDPLFVTLLSHFRDVVSYASAVGAVAELLHVDQMQATSIVDDLIDHKVLVAPDHRPEEDRVAFWEKRGWIEGLVFHRVSRNLPYLDADSGDKAAYDFRQLRLDVKRPLPEAWKVYPSAEVFPLPPPTVPENLGSLEDALLRRRCNRAYQSGELSLRDLGAMLKAASVGVLSARLAAEKALETIPEEYLRHSSWSAIETYVSVHSVEDLKPGLYHYDLREHSLVLVRAGDLREEVRRFCLGQQNSSSGSCNIHLTGIWERYMYRYQHPRAYRNLMVNVAELGQRYLLLATALGLNTFMTPQTLYRQTQEFFGVPHFEEALLYTIGMG